MPLPTLLKKNALRPGMGESKEELDKYIAIDYIMKWFEHRLDKKNIKTVDDKIVILESETGSGKSTTFPTELYIRYNEKIRGNIVVTQPRVATAMKIPETITNIESYKTIFKMKENIGYQTKEYIKKPIKQGILFCTIGILLQFLKSMEPDKFIKKYKVLVLDEAHDRSINLDMIFYYLKQMLKKIKLEDYPFVVIASATLDVYKYANYFETKTIFRVTGTSYEIKDNYLDYDSDNVILSTIETVKNIHLNNNKDDIQTSDIIIFVPTKGLATNIKMGILELNNQLEKKILPLALDSSAFRSSNEDYQNAFTNINNIKINDQKVYRKVIIGTNVIETGITIDSLKYCIDTGLVNVLEYNPLIMSNLLVIKPVTQAMSRQRRGRVGRIQPGNFFPIYTNNIYKSLLPIQYPDIIVSDITISILNIIVINKDNTKLKNKFEIFDNLLDRPSNCAIQSSLLKLYMYGAIDNELNPTELGLLINTVRMMSIENIRMIVSGFVYNCNILDLITIACYIEIGKNVLVGSKFKKFNNTFNNTLINNIDIYNFNTLKLRMLISCEFIDFLLFFYEFSEHVQYIKKDKDYMYNWCNNQKVNFSSMLDFIEKRDEIIIDLLHNINLSPSYNLSNNLNYLFKSALSSDVIASEFIEEVIKIKNCIYEGYKLNTATYNDKLKCYISDINNKKLNITSYLVNNFPLLEHGKKLEEYKPKHILYDSLMVSQNFDGNYEISKVNSISVLSGFVNIDEYLYI